MKQFQEIYNLKKELDERFHEFYDNGSKRTIECNIVEILVELGELANETRCFKYWSKKGSNPKEEVLEEYSDCFMMTLFFCNSINLDLNEEFNSINETNTVDQFKKLFELCAKLNIDLDKNLIKDILVNLVNLGYLLGFSDEDIIHGCIK